MNPLSHLVANQPQLLADHVQAYAELATVQIARADLRVLRMAGAA